ncbi:MAG TPA: hypothetical protein VHB79_29975 [Polyangiaceae bacterium]|nr:hypothetical protein [Polyangiaceae bacterium]
MSVASASKRALALLLAASALGACGRQDGIVGVEPLQAPSAAGAAGTGAGGGAFSEEFVGNSGIWQEQTRLDGASTAFGAPSSDARDGNVAELRLPGHPELGPDDAASARFATEIATKQRFHFGTYRSRLGFGACDPSEEAVMAFLGYYNDGSDGDGDGIIDDLEIDAQVLCGEPQLLYLTVFTDDAPSGGKFRKLSRVIDFSSGEVFDTPSAGSDSFESSGVDPDLIYPELFARGALYELGFEWHVDSIRFFVRLPDAERDVWTLTGAEHVPQQPVYVLYNLWHPALHWYPGNGSADYPANDVTLTVDWLTFEPE